MSKSNESAFRLQGALKEGEATAKPLVPNHRFVGSTAVIVSSLRL